MKGSSGVWCGVGGQEEKGRERKRYDQTEMEDNIATYYLALVYTHHMFLFFFGP